MNSSLCCVETPKKNFISVHKSVATPPSSLKFCDRFSPSISLLKLLENVARIHSYQYHMEVNFSSLEDMEFLTSSVVIVISDYFRSELPDIPDILPFIYMVQYDSFNPFGCAKIQKIKIRGPFSFFLKV